MQILIYVYCTKESRCAWPECDAPADGRGAAAGRGAPLRALLLLLHMGAPGVGRTHSAAEIPPSPLPAAMVSHSAAAGNISMPQ